MEDRMKVFTVGAPKRDEPLTNSNLNMRHAVQPFYGQQERPQAVPAAAPGVRRVTFADVSAGLYESDVAKMPVAKRLEYVAQFMSKRVDAGLDQKTIDWAQVNAVLNQNMTDYDFNAFGNVTSLQTLWKAALDAREAMINGVYRTGRCVSCNAAFSLTYRETQFYKSKNFAPPKRCFKCRKAKKHESG
jgi:glycyl-tRNA synthetase beta subunit